MVKTGKKANRISLVNHTTKSVHRHLHHLETYNIFHYIKLFKHQNKTNAGCRIELSGVGNYSCAIALGANCHMVIVCEAIILGGYCGVGNYLAGFAWGQFLFRVISPSNVFIFPSNIQYVTI